MTSSAILQASDFADGETIMELSTGKIWIAIAGVLHHVSSATVYNSLFRAEIVHTQVYRVTDLSLNFGFPFADGTCLVRFFGSDRVYILTEIQRRVALIHIFDLDVMNRFRFDLSLVRDLPATLRDSFKEIYLLQ